MSDKDQPAVLLIEHAAELVTIAGTQGPRKGSAQSDLGLIRDGALAAGADGRILAVGTTAEVHATVEPAPGAQVIDASGRAVLPGFVDPHTHTVFAGDRADEFASRLEGADYLEVLASGGGIISTVRATRAAPAEQLEERASRYLEEMLRHGTTTLEIKSGYGLSTEDELKMLRVASALEKTGPQGIVATFLGAHAVPPEYRGQPDRYVDLVVDEMMPRVAAEGLARYCDVFCERGAFSVDQSRRVLEAGLARGLGAKIHAEQKSALGGARLAAELGAVSADHLEYATDEDVAALVEAGTVAVLLPGAALMLMESHWAPARRLIEAGVPVALATDFNPGTCPILSMPLILGLACLRRLVTPAEAVVAATLNAAHAVGLGEQVGSLEPGKRADVVILDAPSHVHLAYWFGRNLVSMVIKDGRVVHS
ncbi:MAG TPA: imidazolonepropionase [Chloroflexota bacterium]|nr:imidazolonepropionase [Chloroflexota bacterium]